MASTGHPPTSLVGDLKPARMAGAEGAGASGQLAQSWALGQAGTSASASSTSPPVRPTAASELGGSSQSKRKASEMLQPSKKACLACRARKTRCNGLEPCQHCTKKDLNCSSSGSSRPAGGVPEPGKGDGVDAFVARLQSFAEILRSPRAESVSTQPGETEPQAPLGWAEGDERVVRQFHSGADVLVAYFAEIYPFDPFLPPPSVVPPPTLLSTLSAPSSGSQAPTSPLLLALLAVLVLTPCPSDPAPRSALSKQARREASGQWARRAERRIYEMIEDAGQQYHGRVPLEVIQALSILGMWEWAQNACVSKMTMRQSQALQLCLDLDLHRSDAHLPLQSLDKWQLDLRRRTSWLAYAQALIGSLIGGTSPIFAPYSPSVTAEYPDCSAAPHVWSDQLEALQLAVHTRSFVDATAGQLPGGAMPLAVGNSNGQLTSKEDRDLEYKRLDAILTDMIRASEEKISAFDGPMQDVHDPEVVFCINFRRSALMCQTTTLIDLHRKSAMNNEGGVGLFTKRLCGLPAISDTPPDARITEMFASVAEIASPNLSSSQAARSQGSAVRLPPAGDSSPSFARAQQGFDDMFLDALAHWSPDDAGTSAPQNAADGANDWPDLPFWSKETSSIERQTVPATSGPFSGLQSLAKVRAGVEVIARQEVLNEAVQLSLNPNAIPMLPFCACELVSAAYCLLLLALTLQASDTVQNDAAVVRRELDDIWTSCWLLLRGLRAYGDAWDGPDGFADELQAALNASLALSGLPPREWQS